MTFILFKVWLKCPNAFCGHCVNLSKVLLETHPVLCPCFHKYTNCNSMCPQMPFGTSLSAYIYMA